MLLLVLSTACGKRSGPAAAVEREQAPAAFWVWHRSSPLAENEIQQLRHAGTEELFWQAVETTWTDGRWQSVRIAQPLQPLPGMRVIPVFRIKPDASFLSDPAAVGGFTRMIQLWAGDAELSEIQLDFDCPDRLLSGYATFLRQLAGGLTGTRVSVTALASWPYHPKFGELADSVHRMTPMFYDLHPDLPQDVREGRFRPMADPNDIKLIDLWKKCQSPWLAGLPNFERVSVFDPTGKLVGHLRGWSHDEVFFNPALEAEPLGNGVTRFRVLSDTSISGNPIAAGSILCHRMADADSLSRMETAARKSGASGMLYFTLPGPGIQATHPAPHFTKGTSAMPEVSLSSDGRITLSNPGTSRIPPRPCDPAHPPSPGWRLVMESTSGGSFRTASTGEFPKISTPGNLPPEISRILHLHFSGLAPGKSITSGAVVKPGGELLWSIEPYAFRRSVKFP